MSLYWPYLAIIALPLACAVIGWTARGWWDKAGRKADELARLDEPIPYWPQPHRTAEPITDLEWARIIRAIKESK